MLSVATLIFAAWQERGRDIERETDRLHLLMAQLTGEGGRLIGDSLLLLRAIVALDAVRSGNGEACDAVMLRLASLDERYIGFGVADISGRIWCSARRRNAPVSVAGLDWFEKVKQTRLTAIGNPRIHQIAGQPTLPIGHPVANEAGELIGVAVATIDLSVLNERLAAMRPASSAIITLFNDERVIVARAPDPDKFFGRRLPPGAAVRAPTPSVAFESTALDGVRRIFLQAPILPFGAPPITVAIGADMAAITTVAWENLTRNLVILLLTLSAAAAFIWRNLSRRVLDPLSKVTAAARLVGSGSERTQMGPPYPTGEPGELMTVFDQMDAAIAMRGEEARRAHARLTDAIESLPDGFLLFDRDAALQVSNRRARDIFADAPDLLEAGTTYDAMLGALIERRLVLESIGHLPDRFDDRAQRRSATLRMFDLLFASGRRCRIVDRSTSDGGIVSIVTDTTAQVEQQEALARSEERFRALAENAPVGVFEANAHGFWTYANQRCLRMTGLDTAEPLEARWIASITPEQRPVVVERWLAAVRNGSVFQSEFRLVSNGGKPIDVFGVAAPILADGGDAVGYVGTMVDLTELKSAEAALTQAQKLQALGQLTGGVAHDFNNLLTVMLGSADQIRAAVADDARAITLVDMSREAAQRAADLIKQLLIFARSGSSRAVDLDLSAVVSELEPLLQRSLKNGCHLELHLAPGLPTIHLDRAQLESAILNLSLNACAAMPAGGSFRLQTSLRTVTASTPAVGAVTPAGTYLTLTAVDHGHGMSAETLAKAFEPFFTTKGRGEGTGLGLSMIYGFVSRSGGYIEARSAEGRGSEFTLLFPAGEAAAGSAPLPEDGPAQIPGGSETILVVEDEAYLRSFVAQQLTGLGYRVLQSANAQEAIALLEAGTPVDLLFTDLTMPGTVNGADLARAVRERWPGVKILLTSGFAAGTVGELPSPLLPKPYAFRELAVAIRVALDDVETR